MLFRFGLRFLLILSTLGVIFHFFSLNFIANSPQDWYYYRNRPTVWLTTNKLVETYHLSQSRESYTSRIYQELQRSYETRYKINQRYLLHKLLYAVSYGIQNLGHDGGLEPFPLSYTHGQYSFLGFELSPMTKKLSGVLPVSRDQLPLLINFAFSCKMTNPNLEKLFDVIWIVVPDVQLVEIYRALLNSTSLHSIMRLVGESVVLPQKEKFSRYHGWHIQQDIKLAISAFIRTDYYLCLDADIMCGRELRYEDMFFEDGRAKTSEERAFEFFAYTSGNMNKTCLNTRLPRPIIDNTTRMLAYTPIPLHTHLVYKLAQYFEEREKESWLSSLIRMHTRNHMWTEYILYWVFGISINAYQRLHYGVRSREYCRGITPKNYIVQRWFSNRNDTGKTPFVNVNDHDATLNVSEIYKQLRVSLSSRNFIS